MNSEIISVDIGQRSDEEIRVFLKEYYLSRCKIIFRKGKIPSYSTTAPVYAWIQNSMRNPIVESN